jgi:hypothetical protein
MQGRHKYTDPTLLNETCWIEGVHNQAPITCRIIEIYNHWAWIDCPASSQISDQFFFRTADGNTGLGHYLY